MNQDFFKTEEALGNLLDIYSMLCHREGVDFTDSVEELMRTVPDMGERRAKTSYNKCKGKMPKTCSYCPMVHTCKEINMDSEPCKKTWRLVRRHFAM